MVVTWQTKWGVRRVAYNPPTLLEAIEAAEGLARDPTEQITIAASLLGVSREEIESDAEKILKSRVCIPNATERIFASSRAPVEVVRKPRRRLEMPVGDRLRFSGNGRAKATKGA